MRLYKHFCVETFNGDNALADFSLRYPDNYNFGYDVADEMAKLAPSDRALVWRDDSGRERVFTFEDISRLSNQAANVFIKYGIKKGDKVLVILKRNYEYWYVAPALHKIGAVMIPATHMLTVEDIKYRIKTADITAAICSSQSGVVEKTLEAAQTEPRLQTIFSAQQDIPGAVDFAGEMKSASAQLTRMPTSATDPMLIYFTSGTTGYPKAVMHDHTYTLCHILTAKHWQCVEEGGLHLTIAETGWGKASWGKIYGQWLCGCAVMVYDFDKFSPAAVLSMMQKYKVTSFCAPPTIYRYFVKKDLSKYDLSSLKHLTTAGEALNPEVFKIVKKQLGLDIKEGFGQTETTLMLGTLNNTPTRFGSMGKPSPLYNIQLLNADGETAKNGEAGEIMIFPDAGRGYGIFQGYCDNAELYKQAWRDGKYHTGDIAYQDADGYYYYVGRIDDLIKTSGYRVGPFEIENILMEHPAVLECAVIGVPDANRGQAIKASIVLADGYVYSNTLRNEIRAFANKRMAAYKHIQHFEFIESMPKTISGKIKHKDLRAPQLKPYQRIVNYYEVDKLGVVHHHEYFKFFEEARFDFLNQLGCSHTKIEQKGVSTPNIGANASYRQPLRYGDSFTVATKLANFTGVKIAFDYIIQRNGQITTEGHTEHVFVNEDFKPISIKRKLPEVYNKLLSMRRSSLPNYYL